MITHAVSLVCLIGLFAGTEDAPDDSDYKAKVADLRELAKEKVERARISSQRGWYFVPRENHPKR